MREVVIVSAVRTPVGKFQGALSALSAVELGAICGACRLERAGLDPADVDECIMGCVLPAGLGQAPARQAALTRGFSDRVSALTINMVCGSGLRAVGLAAQSIALGDAEIVVAGGMESMSNAPYLLPARAKARMGDQRRRLHGPGRPVVRLRELAHGMSAEAVAEKHSFTREQQDAFARRVAPPCRGGLGARDASTPRSCPSKSRPRRAA